MARTNFRTIRTKTGYAPWLADLAGANGVYIIRRRARRRQAALILYVGESHTHRLRETLQRHFQQWTGTTAGPTFDAADTEVAVEVLLMGQDAIEVQNRYIRRLRPIHNIQIPAPEEKPKPKKQSKKKRPSKKRPSKKRPSKKQSSKKRPSKSEAYDEVAAFFEGLSA